MNPILSFFFAVIDGLRVYGPGSPIGAAPRECLSKEHGIYSLNA
jgi:hypothetical protein